jgi:pSer/pThr/pTyr-binding forkhead associated (FHA) protein
MAQQRTENQEQAAPQPLVLVRPDEGADVIDGKLSIGSAAENDIVVHDPRVSRHHCTIELLPDGRTVLQDNGSLNGTWVDGTRVYRGELRPGMRIRIGTTVLRIVAAKQETLLIGGSPALTRLRSEIQTFARSRAALLIQGETGTGKELVAQTLHELSGRTGPFVAISCAEIPPSLAETFLFGHVRGAFTGAAGDARGVFEQADDGTLFLDEVGELSPGLQSRLLRTLESGKVRRIGSGQDISIDVRVIAATNVDIDAAVEAGRFRADLFYRLGHRLFVPPLRERREDVYPLHEGRLFRLTGRGQAARHETERSDVGRASRRVAVERRDVGAVR